VISSDLPAFSLTFDGLARMLSRRMDDGERANLLADYFKALQSYSLESVQAAAEVIAQKARYFPKPVEWVDAMPRVTEAAFVPLMTAAEVREWRRAEAKRWEDDPCACAACKRASVDWKPLRFVPEIDASGRDRRVKDGERDRVVVAGHWAHGDELDRWYRPKAEFFGIGDELGSKTLKAVLAGKV
jgi:hypothetical protein